MTKETLMMLEPSAEKSARGTGIRRYIRAKTTNDAKHGGAARTIAERSGARHSAAKRSGESTRISAAEEKEHRLSNHRQY